MMITSLNFVLYVKVTQKDKMPMELVFN